MRENEWKTEIKKEMKIERKKKEIEEREEKKKEGRKKDIFICIYEAQHQNNVIQWKINE